MFVGTCGRPPSTASVSPTRTASFSSCAQELVAWESTSQQQTPALSLTLTGTHRTTCRYDTHPHTHTDSLNRFPAVDSCHCALENFGTLMVFSLSDICSCKHLPTRLITTESALHCVQSGIHVQILLNNYRCHYHTVNVSQFYQSFKSRCYLGETEDNEGRLREVPVCMHAAFHSHLSV